MTYSDDDSGSWPTPDQKLTRLITLAAINKAQIQANPVPYLETMMQHCKNALATLDQVEHALGPDTVFDAATEMGIPPAHFCGSARAKVNAAHQILRGSPYGLPTGKEPELSTNYHGFQGQLGELGRTLEQSRTAPVDDPIAHLNRAETYLYDLLAVLGAVLEVISPQVSFYDEPAPGMTDFEAAEQALQNQARAIIQNYHNNPPTFS